MKKINAQQAKELRDKTGAGFMEARNALAEASGDMEKARDILRKKGQMKAEKKSARVTRQGIIDSYIHGEGRIGVLLEVNCETDFVARNADFKNLVHDLSLHIAASAPLYVSRNDVPEDVIAKEKEIYRASSADKQPAILEKIVQGKLEKYFQQVCLLEQDFVKNPDQKIQDLINEKIASTGENIQVRRFVRYVLGE